MATDNLSYFDQILARKEAQALRDQLLHVPDSLEAAVAWYLRMSILGVREQQIATRRTSGDQLHRVPLAIREGRHEPPTKHNGLAEGEEA